VSEETKDWELWRQRNGHVVVVKTLDNDAPDLYRFQSVNCGTQGWFPRGRHSLGEDNHPLDLVRFLGIVRSADQKPKPSAPCQAAEIERLRTEVERLERQSAQYDAGWKTALSTLAERLTENERLQAELQTVKSLRNLANTDSSAEFTAAQQLRAENESLTVRLQRAEVAAAEALQKWETTEQVCLKIITELVKGVRS
jgi:hypothetical protein